MPSSSVAAQMPSLSSKRPYAASSSVDTASPACKKRPHRPSPSSNLWFDRLTPDLQVYLARFLSAGDSTGQTSTLLDVADASAAMRAAALAALRHRLVLYYAAPNPARWTALFCRDVRTVVYGDDWPGKFASDVVPRPATLFSASTLTRAEFNAEDEDVLQAVRESRSVREVVVRVHSGAVCQRVLETLKTLRLESVEMQCHALQVADCPFGSFCGVHVSQHRLQECCRGAKVTRLCVGKCHLMYLGGDSTGDK